MSYFGVSTRNGVGLGLGTVPSLTNTPLGYRLAPSLDLSFAGSDTLDPRITFSRTTNATLTNSAGLVANAPMNLLTFSEQFDNAAWTKFVSATVAANTAVAPNGTTTADTLSLSASANSRIEQTVTAVSGQTYTFSVWMRVASGTLSVRLYGIDTGSGTAFTVNTEWQRFSITQVASSGTRFPSIVTDGTAGSVLVWGAQLELGSTATTYNPTTVKNLLGFTENFDNAAWTKSNASISATKVDDIYGQPFAQKLVENTANAAHRVQVTVVLSGAPVASSAYFKAGERSFGYLRFDDASSTRFAYFNLASGTLGTVDAALSAAIQDVGNGWYRCSAVFAAPVATGSGVCVIGAASTNNVAIYTGDGTSGIYIFGAQLSDSASVDPYVYQPVAAPSSVAYYGPRFDYDPVTLAPKGLLIEEQRTNLCLYSGAVGGTGWVSTNGGAGAIPTVTLNAAVAPDGTSTASRVQLSLGGGTTTTDQSLVVQALTGTSCRGSFYVKTNDNSTKTIYARGLNAASFVVDGTWRRYDFDAGTLSGTQFGIGLRGGQGTANSNTADILVWGAQLEAGAFATSYIPTVASQVTRAADSASMIGNNFARWYNQTEGTVFAQYSVNGLNPGASNAACGISDNTTANFIAGRTLSSAATNFQVRTGGADQVALNSTSVAAGAVAKSAGAYALNNFAFTANAETAQTDTAGTLPVVTQMQIGGLTSSVNPLNGTISRIAYYNRRLSNTELQGITS